MNPTLTPDVFIAGLGPAGSSAARAAAAAGCRVLAVDRKRSAGEPVQCAEFVPTMLSPLLDAVQATRCQRISAMHTFVETASSDRHDHFPGVMIDRARFDQRLVRDAVNAGAQCRFATTVKAIDADGTVRLSSGETVRSAVLIGADGPRSRIGRAIGSVNTQTVATRQITVPLCHPHQATDIFLSAAYGGGYAWLFPRGDLANLGLGVAPERIGALANLLERLHQLLITNGRVTSQVLSRTGGVIPVGGMLNPCSKLGERLVLLCGDAAGLTNPITGAGIGSAVLSGTEAGESSAAWLAGDIQAGQTYSDELNDVFGRALQRASLRRQQILATYVDDKTPSADELRRAWIAYPQYWAASVQRKQGTMND